MNENIDLTKILKDCPRGTKLYTPIWGEVTFVEVRGHSYDCLYPIRICNEYDNYINLSKYGHYVIYKQDSECILFPSKDQRDWSKFVAPWYKKDRFDPKTLKPFDRVLVRDCEYHKWTCDLFSHMCDNTLNKFQCFGFQYNYCIPYNEETKHLVGTTEEAPEFYCYWKD